MDATSSVRCLADRYHELMDFRREALAMYGATEFSVIRGPHSRVALPAISLSGHGKKQIGPFRFDDRPPIVPFVEDMLRSFPRPATVLEIGPGRGELAKRLRSSHAARIAAYFAYDRDASVEGPYESVASLDSVTDRIDLVIASEVIEHMTADQLYDRVLSALAPKMSPAGAFVVSTPNPVAPGGIARDLTHVQNYPWYDLYAMFRLVFADVSIYRTYYLFDPRRVVSLVPRIVLCSLLELDWRDGLVCVARTPRRDAPTSEGHRHA